MDTSMIENTDLTLRILQHFAMEDVPFPANLSIEDLKNAFPNDNANSIEYSVICAFQSGLLSGHEPKAVHTFDGTMYTFGWFDGLTASGGEYVRNAATHYDKAVNAIKDVGLEITTSTIKDALKVMIAAAIANSIG